MTMYRFLARNAAGADISGERDAKDSYELARALRGEGFTVISVEESSSKKQRKSLDDYLPTFLNPIKLEDKINVTRNLAVMVGAGLSLTKALEVMSRQTQNKHFQEVLFALTDFIKKGETLADSLGKYHDVFPKFYQEMVRAGEKSGKLEEALTLISLQLKKDYTLRRKVRSAMMYPIIIIVTMIGIGILMLIYVVPTLVSTFKELNVQLPASTRFIIYISESLTKSGLIFLGGVIVLSFVLYKSVKTTQGKRVFDLFFVRMPVLSGITKKFNSARTCRTLSSLISSGVNILEALSTTHDVVQNHLYQQVLRDAKEKIQKGGMVSRAFLDAEKLYPPLVGEMMAVGEETGELSQMLLRLAKFYENEVAIATKDLSTIIEPTLMILIGIVVGFFAVSMMSPMYNLAGSI